MSAVQAILFGMGMLILAYLAFKNSGGVAQIMDASGAGIIQVSKSLQGRK